jgi:hypothetical protein
MIDLLDVKKNDRFLLLSIPEPSFVVTLAAKLTEGIVVGLGPDEDVRAARKEVIDVGNVMFIPAEPYDIPWQGGFFTKAVDLACRWDRPDRTAREIARVLSSRGTVYLAEPSATRDHLLNAGFREVSSVKGLLIMERHG